MKYSTFFFGLFKKNNTILQDHLLHTLSYFSMSHKRLNGSHSYTPHLTLCCWTLIDSNVINLKTLTILQVLMAKNKKKKSKLERDSKLMMSIYLPTFDNPDRSSWCIKYASGTHVIKGRASDYC